MNKPKPIIQKITFTKKQQQEINDLLEHKQRKCKYTKNHSMISPHYVTNILKKEYYHGICCICGEFPEYKVIHKMNGINLVEHYCQDHFDKII